MRLLVRANAHRPILNDGSLVGVEVAASPDTATRPERWAWHVRLLDPKAHLNPWPGHMLAVDDSHEPSAGSARTRVDLDFASGFAAVEVDVDPDLVRASTHVVGVGDETVLERAEEELIVLVAASGEVLLEDRHTLLAGDAMVLTGDDPLSARVSTAHGSAVVIRLRTPLGNPVGWVP